MRQHIHSAETQIPLVPGVVWRAVVCLFIVLAGCSTGTAIRTGEETSDACLLLPASSMASDTLRIAADAVPLERGNFIYGMTHGPLLTRQLHRNLFTLDCDGRRRPDIATAWATTDGGKTWVFDIRTDLRYSDGARFTADRVAARLNDLTFPFSAALPKPAVDSIRAISDNKIAVYLRRSLPEPPTVLASPHFATQFTSVQGAILSGGATRYTLDGKYSRPDALRPDPFFDLPFVQLISQDSAEDRDLLASGIDMLITSDRDVVAFARTDRRLTVVPLPYDAVYVLVGTTRFIEPDRIQVGNTAFADVAGEFSAGAVRAESREAVGDYWWSRPEPCGLSWPPGGQTTPRPAASFYTSAAYRILYDSADEVAGDLSQRLAALSLEDASTNEATDRLSKLIPGFSEPGVTITAPGRATGALDRSLASGNDFAYVLRLPVRSHAPCADLDHLRRRVPWLASSATDLERSLVPLIETRPFLIVREGHPDLYVDGFGSIVMGKSTNLPGA